MFTNCFSRKWCRLWDNVEKIWHSHAGDGWNYSVAKKKYNFLSGEPRQEYTHTHTLIIIDPHCFSTTTMVTRTRHSVTLHVVSGIRWYNLQVFWTSTALCIMSSSLNVELWIKKYTVTSFVALGMLSEGNALKSGEPTVGFSFATMLQHTSRI